MYADSTVRQIQSSIAVVETHYEIHEKGLRPGQATII
jgi:hypothetical protein